MIFALALLLATLDGEYVQDCRQGVRRSEEFRGDSVVYEETNFRESNCRQAQVSSRSYGTYRLGGNLARPEGGREIDFFLDHVSLIPLEEEVADLYNRRAVCGMEGWKAGTETDVTGLECDFLGGGIRFQVPARGSVRYGVFKVKEGEIYFGKLSPGRDASRPDRRPQEWDPLPYRSRQAEVLYQRPSAR